MKDWRKASNFGPPNPVPSEVHPNMGSNFIPKTLNCETFSNLRMFEVQNQDLLALCWVPWQILHLHFTLTFDHSSIRRKDFYNLFYRWWKGWNLEKSKRFIWDLGHDINWVPSLGILLKSLLWQRENNKWVEVLGLTTQNWSTIQQHTCTGNQCESTPCIAILISTNKTLGPSYYCLYSLFNKIRDKGKIVSAW
jgi:hypothetical protein